MSTQLEAVYGYLRELKAHNDRGWFEAHRGEYEQAKRAFEDFVQDLTLRFDPIEPLSGAPPKDFVMRIYRDVRFSKDKSPYRTSFAASFARGGKKSHRLPYYVHLEPEGSFLAGGVYMPDAAQLKRIRAVIAEDSREIRAIVGARAFTRYFDALSGSQLKTAPKGYAVDAPDIDLLRRTQFLAVHAVSESQVCDSGFSKHVIAVFAAMRPFNEYFNRVLGLA